MKDSLPRPSVSVTNTAGKPSVTISREEGKGKNYIIEGSSIEDKIKDAVEKIINDAHNL